MSLDKYKPQITTGKPLIKQVSDRKYLRYAIRTHFINIEDNYIDVIKQYVLAKYQEGDILAICEKIIAIMQNQIIHKDQLVLSRTAKFLARFVEKTPAGQGVGNPHKMQLAIETAGFSRIMLGAIVSGITKPLGIKGLFYKIVGNEVWAIDGFNNLAYDYYQDKGILTPKNPTEICNDIEKQLGIKAVIVDANDLNVEILGKSTSVKFKDKTLQEILIDNPAGQKNEQTPFILIREV